MQSEASTPMSPSSSSSDRLAPAKPHPLSAAAASALDVVLIRHAERVARGADPALSAAGRARASLLARMLGDASVKAVHVTQFLRSRQTGQPTATAVGVPVSEYDATDTAALAAAITGSHSSGTVLVVAHSNTVDDIAAALGAPGAGELAETEFDRMFIIARRSCGTTLLRLRYGAEAH
jgi:broad specificity phosphatase PhoE